ncbi:MAG: M24 family metallopeptidase C-terminal domain-containing protein, partial [Rhodospirillales bacterium]
MILSNEPGYYREGAFGIRIENLVLVVNDTDPTTERPFLRFETLTVAPFERRLIDVTLLTADEREWVDGYHARVLADIGPLLDAVARAWLERAAAPL